jgi:K+-sensing histidine kinase KdpD
LVDLIILKQLNLLKKSLEKTNKVAAKDVVEQCLSVFYPEIYSRQLTIIKSLSDTPELNIKYCDFVKIVIGLLSRSFMFSSKNNQISIQTKVKTMNETKRFYLTVEDNGLGNEEWRIKSLNNCSEFKEMELIIKKSGGILKSVNKSESGVKYCMLLPYKEKEPTQDLRKKDKIIFFPSNNFKK